MSNNVEISVIIPAYNCSSTVANAVKSVGSTLSDIQYEILIVENGSTDNTLSVINQLSDHDSHVKVLTSTKGVSNARNVGIDAACGDYVMFVDADDQLVGTISSRNFEHLRSFDLITYNFISGQKKIEINHGDKVITESQTEGTVKEMLENPTTFMTVWGKLFNNKIINKYNLRFDSNLKFSEDSLFLLEYLMHASTIFRSHQYMYHYQRASDSAVRKYDKNKVAGYLSSLTAFHDYIFQFAKEYASSYYIFGLMQLNLMCVHGIFDKNNNLSLIRKRARLKSTVSNPLIKECLDNVPLSQMRNKRFLAIILIKLHCYFFAGIIFNLRSKHS